MKKLEKPVVLTCPNCKNEFCIDDPKTIEVMPIGYKGDYKFYTHCKKCNYLFTIEKEKIPKRIAIKLRIGMFF